MEVLIRLTDKLNGAIAYRICVVEERAGMLILSYGMKGSFIDVYFFIRYFYNLLSCTCILHYY